MYRNLFVAWYCLGVLVLCLFTFFGLLPFLGAERAKGAFSFLGLLGLLPVFMFVLFGKEKNDERDVSFLQRAIGFGASYGFGIVFLLNSYFWFFYRYIIRIETIPIGILWIPSVCGLLIAMLISAVILLLFYYKGENADKESGL